jgi:hypothetical protein
MSFSVKTIGEVSDQEWNDYRHRRADVQLMMNFHKQGFDEKDWLSDIIKSANQQCKKLIRSYSLNSSQMNHREVEAWKRVYNESSLCRALHLRIYFKLYGEEFLFE